MRYAIFLRGVNVGGIKVASAELTRVLGALGLTDVRTYVASGNVTCETDLKANQVQPEVEAVLSKAFSYDAHVQVFSHSELAAIVEGYPFETDDDHHRYVSQGQHARHAVLEADQRQEVQGGHHHAEPQHGREDALTRAVARRSEQGAHRCGDVPEVALDDCALLVGELRVSGYERLEHGPHLRQHLCTAGGADGDDRTALVRGMRLARDVPARLEAVDDAGRRGRRDAERTSEVVGSQGTAEQVSEGVQLGLAQTRAASQRMGEEA